MKTKKYNASSIPEAMKLVRAELGEDAVILNSKVVVTKKFFGLIKKKSFEVIAGIDRIEPNVSAPATVQPTFKLKENTKLQEITNAMQAQNQAEYEQTTLDDSGIPKELKQEIADLKALMQSMHKQTTQAQYPDELLPFIEYLRQ